MINASYSVSVDSSQDEVPLIADEALVDVTVVAAPSFPLDPPLVAPTSHFHSAPGVPSLVVAPLQQPVAALQQQSGSDSARFSPPVSSAKVPTDSVSWTVVCRRWKGNSNHLSQALLSQESRFSPPS